MTIMSADPHLAIGVDVDSLVVIAQQKLHAVGVGERHDAVWRDGTLGLKQYPTLRLNKSTYSPPSANKI